MKVGVTLWVYRIMRAYAQGEIQARRSVLETATGMPLTTLQTVLGTMVRDGLLTVRCVAGEGGWDELYTLTSEGRFVAQQVREHKREDIEYHV